MLLERRRGDTGYYSYMTGGADSPGGGSDTGYYSYAPGGAESPAGGGVGALSGRGDASGAATVCGSQRALLLRLRERRRRHRILLVRARRRRHSLGGGVGARGGRGDASGALW